MTRAPVFLGNLEFLTQIPAAKSLLAYVITRPVQGTQQRQSLDDAMNWAEGEIEGFMRL